MIFPELKHKIDRYVRYVNTVNGALFVKTSIIRKNEKLIWRSHAYVLVGWSFGQIQLLVHRKKGSKQHKSNPYYFGNPSALYS